MTLVKDTAMAEIGMDDAAFEEHKAHCPLYAENPPFNAKTLAAIAEGRAIMRGEIPGKWYKPREEFWKALEED